MGMDQHQLHSRTVSDAASDLSRRTTPPVPPGFSATPIQRPQKGRTASTAVVTPAVPIIAPGRIGTPLRKEIKADVDEGTIAAKAEDDAASPLVGLAASIAVPRTRPSKKDEDEMKPDKDNKVEPVPSAQNVQGSADSKVTSISTKRQPPGKLDIAAAITLPETASDPPTAKKTDTTTKQQPSTSASASLPPSRPETPGAVLTGSPIRRTTQPRTIRVVPTPKTETPPPPSATSATSAAAAAILGPSRKASVASITIPGTPSELISDNASVTSASASMTMSRASSPPPLGSKVGSAPVKKSKAQAVRERKQKADAAKLALEEETRKKTIDEPVQAPILGRKKKEKKKDKVPSLSKGKAPEVAPGPPAIATPAVASEHTDTRAQPKYVDDQDEQDTAPSSSAALELSAPEVSTLPEKNLTPASVFKELQAHGEVLPPTLEMLKHNVTGLSSQMRHDPTLQFNDADMLNLTTPPRMFSKEDLDLITKAQEPLRWQNEDGKGRTSGRHMVGLGGRWLRMLTPEEEERYIELEKRLNPNRVEKKPVAWNPPERSELLHRLISENSSLPRVNRSYESIFDPDQYGSEHDASADGLQPLGHFGADEKAAYKLHKSVNADEALQYVNQFILPSRPLPHPQTGKHADAIYLGHATGGAEDQLGPGFVVDQNSYRFVGVGGEPALVGAVGPSADSASGGFLSSGQRRVGVGEGPGVVDAWTAMKRMASARDGARRAFLPFQESPVPELGWSGRTFSSVAEGERAVAEAKKEVEKLEKQFATLVKKNRKALGVQASAGVAAH